MRKERIAAIALLCLVFLLLGYISGPTRVEAQQTSNAQYQYIATATTTTVKAQAGFLQTVTINGGTAGVVTLYDIAGTGCTGTPASGKFATIESIAATNPTTLTYNLRTLNGLCVVTAAATDVTVTFN